MLVVMVCIKNLIAEENVRIARCDALLDMLRTLGRSNRFEKQAVCIQHGQ